MWKILGVLFLLGGVMGVLYSWVDKQRENQKQVDAFLFFLRKSLYVMQNEKIKMADYLKRYIEHNLHTQEYQDKILERTLEEIIKRLSDNIYPNGQMVWEEVLKEEKGNLYLDKEVFQIMVQAGNGFFGRSREENICFLEKSIKELEQQQARLKERHIQERKVWIPVGMLGSIMLVILFL